MSRSTLLRAFDSLSLSSCPSCSPCPRSTLPRHLSTSHPSLSNDGQSSWDTFDPSSSLAPATSLKQASPPRRNSPRGFQSRSPSSFSRKRPPLPSPSDPTLSLSNLDPTHLSSLRLSYMNSYNSKIPSLSQLTTYLPLWLKQQHRLLLSREKEEKQKNDKLELKRERMDSAWMWEKRESEKLGIERTTEEIRKDDIVRKRIEKRLRERRERDKDKELRKWDNMISSKQQPELEQEEVEEDTRPDWKKHKEAIKERFPGGWAPPKRISREAMDLLRTAHKVDPETNSVPVLSQRFKISPEAVRRVLKSRFELDRNERDKRENKRKEERMRQVSAGNGRSGQSEERGEAWSGDRAREKDEMRRLREKNEASVDRTRREPSRERRGR